MKIKKSFRNHTDLSVVKHNIETLITYYPPECTIGDILQNVRENEEKWEECPKCKGTGIIKKDIGVKRNKQGKRTYGFFPCDKCKQKKWIRKTKPKSKEEA